MCLAAQALVLRVLRSLSVADLKTDDGMNDVGALKPAHVSAALLEGTMGNL